MYAEKPFDQAVARRVVAAVRQGSLKPDAFGVADLPPAFAAATTEAVITVTRPKKGLVPVFFPTCNERFGARGYLYCSRPLTPADTTLTWDKQKDIVIKSPDGRYVLGGPSAAHGTELIVPLTQQLDAHWWHLAEVDHEV